MRLREFFSKMAGRVVYVNVPNVSVQGMDAAELYRTQPALRAVISFLADNVAGLPLHAYIRNSDTDRPRDTTSTLALLLLRPSSYMTSHELIRATASDYLLHGGALWYVVPSVATPSGFEIYHIPYAWMDEEPTLDGLQPHSYTFTNPATGKRVTIPADDCIRFFAYDPDGVNYASGAVESLKQVLAEQMSAWKFRNSSWKNGGLVSAWLFRPKDAPAWTDTARERFAKSWKARFSRGGTDTGGTPLLEDGMELRTTQFNAHEAQWAEATKLTREDVAAAFHVNPALIWHTDGQSYASAKDNARALYADTLAPILDMIEERINAFLVPRINVAPNSYVAFDLQAKLAGSFEERASILQSSVGAPWITRNEARAMQDLPALPDGDELVTPLNVLTGGLAAPNDTDPTVERYEGLEEVKSAPERKASGRAYEEEAEEVKDVVKKFLDRQKRSVLPSIEKRGLAECKASDDWWNEDRWNSELTADLFPVFFRQSRRAARRTLASLGLEDAYNAERTRAYIQAMAELRARRVNQTTKRKLDESIAGEFEEGAEQSTPEGVFELNEERADMYGLSFATAVTSWAAMESVRQQGGDATKTWVVNSGNPRPEHAAMNGETVPLNETFSNGAEWPGDSEALDAADLCNCQCSIDIIVN